MSINKEQLLTWLQEFYINKINFVLLPSNIGDVKIGTYALLEKIPAKSGMLRVHTVSNPGWHLEFNHQDILYNNKSFTNIEINCGINLVDQESEEWLDAQYRENIFSAGGGPLYLCITLEAFRSFIEQKRLIIDDLITFREDLKKNNSLLCWLEEFYYSCCDTDWEHMYGYSLISVREGWLMVLSVEELCYEDYPFERVIIEEEGGKVECYMLENQFIIRAHCRGLITGIRIFKEWIEEQPSYEEKRKDS